MISIPPSRLPSDLEFNLGTIQVTHSALAAIKDSGEWVWTFIFKHMAGEWDELSEAERKENEEALVNGNPIISRHTTATGVKLVVRTDEEPRSCTTVMLAQENEAS